MVEARATKRASSPSKVTTARILSGSAPALNREWRLTDLGIAQAQAAGEFIRKQVSPTFSRYYTSEYLRARETAAHLRLPEARWVQDILLRERSWGRADFVMPESQRYERFSAELAARREDPCYWRPPEGESLAEVCLRVERVLHTHGQVLHYTRRDPATSECSGGLEWVRSSCPWAPARARSGWCRIKPPSFSNEDLLSALATTERLIPGPPVEPDRARAHRPA